MEPVDTTPVVVLDIVPLEQARVWEAYWAKPSDYQLRNQLAEMNTGLIGWTLNRFLPKGLPQELEEEMKQEAYLGLIKAVEMFDPTKGFRFGTYAPYWIRQGADRFLKNTKNPIRIPVHVGEVSGHIWKAEKSFFRQEGRMPTDEELATFLGFPIEAITEIRKLVTPVGVVSLNQRAGGGSNSSELGELFADPTAVNPFEEVARFEVPEGVNLEKLREAFERLQERSREMLILSARDHTLEEIGKRYSITRERVRQVIKRGIEDIRKVLGIDPELPIRSIRLADHIDDSATIVVHGVTLNNFVQRIKQVDEEVRRYGRAKLRLPASVRTVTRRQKPSITGQGRSRVGVSKGQRHQTPKERKSIVVRVISTKSLPPAFTTLRREAEHSVPTPPARVLVTEEEFEVASAAWRRLSYGKWGNLDFLLVAEEAKLPLAKVHLISCALIAKGVIQQDRPGMYQQGWPNLAVKRKGEIQLEIDLELNQSLVTV